MDFKKILNTLNLLIPLCYIAVGILLLMGLFHVIDRGKSILFGVIVIAYGIFRANKACVKVWRRP